MALLGHACQNRTLLLPFTMNYRSALIVSVVTVDGRTCAPGNVNVELTDFKLVKQEFE